MTDLYRRLLEAHAGRAENIPVRLAGAPAPLSLAQERMWLLEQLTEEATRSHQLRRFRLRGRLDVAALHGALLDLQTRQEILRTRVPTRDGRPFQEVMPVADIPLPLEDLRGLAPSEKDLRLSAMVVEQRRAFDLERDVLWRLRLARLDDEEHQLFITLHEVIADGASVGILYRELAAFYSARLAGSVPELPPLPIQYADYATWQRARIDDEDFAQQLEYWRTSLRGVSAVELPRKRPVAARSRRSGCEAVVIDSATSAALRALCIEADATLFMGLLAAFQSLLARYTGNDVIAVGVPIANRLRRQTRPLIGRFANGLLLRTDLSGDPSFSETLRRTRETALGGFARQEMPLERIFDVLAPARVSAAPLFNVMFALQGQPGRLQLGELDVEEVWKPNGAARNELVLSVAPAPNETLLARMVFDPELLDAQLVAQMANDYARLLADVVAQPAAAVGALRAAPGPIFPVDRPANPANLDDALLHVRVAEHAASRPRATAIAFPGGVVDYGELARHTLQLSHHLLALGVRVGAPVVVLLDASVDLIATLAALLQIGATAVRLDPAAPIDHLRAAVVDCGAQLLITTSKNLPTLEGVRRVELDQVRDQLVSGSTTAPEIRVGAEQLATIVYALTPSLRQGVAIARSALGARVGTLQAELALDRHDVVLHLAMTVDPAAVELVVALASGATLSLAPGAVPNERVTTLFLLPGQLAALLEDLAWSSWSGLRRVICAGDGLTPALQDRFFARSSAALYRSYVTEETGTAAIRRCAPDALARTVPIGHAVAQMRLRVLDGRLRPVPVGCEGELCVTGAQLATGYHGSPAMTPGAFVPDPFGPSGTLMYRSGDRARQQFDGAVELLGSVADQIRIRDLRIAPTDVENVIAEVSAVRQVVVVERGERLVAYIVPNDGFDASRVREHVASRLPGYMVPSAIVTVAVLPVDTCGRVVRAELPQPEEHDPTSDTYVAPRTPDESALAKLWCERLGIRHVGVHDDFFELGGHSLLAIQMIAEIERALDVRIPLRLLFVGRTIAAIAREVAARRGTDASARDRPRVMTGARRARLLPPQRGTYRLHQDAPSNHLNRQTWSVWLDGDVDARALERALTALRERHGILRARFYEADGELWQEVLDAAAVAFPVLVCTDLQRLAPEEQGQADTAFQEQFLGRPFELASGEVMRAALVAFSSRRSRLTVTMHRVVCDDESKRVFIAELAQLWAAFVARVDADPAAVLPPPVHQYLDLADYLDRLADSQVGRRHHEFWSQTLDGAVPLELPNDLPRVAVEARRDAKTGFATFPMSFTRAELDAKTSEAVRRIATSEHALVQATLMAAMAAYLRGLTGQTDLAIVSYLIYRHLPGFEAAMGLFANPLVMRISGAGGATFRELIARTQTVMTSAYEHGECDVLGRASHRMFRLCFNYIYTAGKGAAGATVPWPPGVAVTPAALPEQHPKFAFDLMLFIIDQGDEIGLTMAYNLELFTAERAQQFVRGYAEHVARACSAPDAGP
ncbi:MAG: AMP-binding protein [Deltaproteobacteria bacterium]|nr:AMP-binding protein [Deltaproteobacteria bacterium]